MNFPFKFASKIFQIFAKNNNRRVKAQANILQAKNLHFEMNFERTALQHNPLMEKPLQKLFEIVF